MAIELNHTIVHASNPAASAAFLSELFDLAPPRRFGPFHVVDTANGVSLDYMPHGASGGPAAIKRALWARNKGCRSCFTSSKRITSTDRKGRFPTRIPRTRRPRRRTAAT